MATIDSLPIVQEILRNDGTYPGDPQCFAVHSYVNTWGDRAFHLAFTSCQVAEMKASPYVRDPVLLWAYGRLGLTGTGRALLEEKAQ